jgi:hypothetical protein
MPLAASTHSGDPLTAGSWQIRNGSTSDHREVAMLGLILRHCTSIRYNVVAICPGLNLLFGVGGSILPSHLSVHLGLFHPVRSSKKPRVV